MDFSLLDSQDEDACYTRLVELLHPELTLAAKSGNAWDPSLPSHVKQSRKVQIGHRANG